MMFAFPLWGSAVFGRAPLSPFNAAGEHWGLQGDKPPHLECHSRGSLRAKEVASPPGSANQANRSGRLLAKGRNHTLVGTVCVVKDPPHCAKIPPVSALLAEMP